MIDSRRPDVPGGAEPAGRHVLFATRWYPSFDSLGRGTFVADQAAALVAAAADVTVASWEPAMFRDTFGQAPLTPAAVDTWLEAIEGSCRPVAPVAWGAPGVPVIRLPAVVAAAASGDVLANAAHEARGFLRIGARLDSDRPIHVVHAHTGLPDGLAAMALADRLGVPLVVTEHDSTLSAKLGDPALRTAYRSLLGPGRRLVAVSGTLARSIAEGLGVDVTALAVIPNVVDVAAFRPIAAADRDPNELLWVGAIKANKGIALLLEAFRQLHAGAPSLRLRLIGSTPTAAERATLEGLAAQLGVADVVRFEPPVDRAGVAAAMERAAVFVHPSPYETFGIVAAEALATGLPVAATPSGGVPEILGADNAFGAVANGHDAASLAAAVRGVLARRMSYDPHAMRASVLERYAPDVVARRLLELYDAAQQELRGDESVPRSASKVLPWRAAAVSATPAQTSAHEAPLLLGLLRSAALARVSAMPAALAGTLVLVTNVEQAPAGAGGPTKATGPSSVPLLEVDVERDYQRARSLLGGAPPRGGVRRALWVARSPSRAIKIRQFGALRPEMLLQTARAALREILETRTRDGRVVEVLPLSVDDLVVIEPLLSQQIRLCPATLRGLVDQWDAVAHRGAA